MILLNTALAGGLATAALPIIIHIAHRRKFKTVDWGAMRFLLEMLARSRRRLFIEEWLLLAVRVLAVLTLALALTRPALEPSGELGAAEVRVGRTAAVVLIDDSASTGVRTPSLSSLSSGQLERGASSTMLDAMKSLALAYVDTLEAGDEMSVVRLSGLHEPPADPLFDRQAAKTLVEAVTTTDSTSDVPALLEAGLARLGRHLNPGSEIVLVTDGQAPGWRLHERARWAEIRKRLAGPPGAKRGTRSRPRLVVLAPPAASGEVPNAAVSGLRLDRSLVGPHMRVSARVELTEQGGALRAGSSVRLLVDGRQIDVRRLDVEGRKESARARREVVFGLSFDEPGSHVIEAVLDGARDAYPRDDRRALAVEVVRRLPVLLVEPARAQAEKGVLSGPLGFVALALDPAAKTPRTSLAGRASLSPSGKEARTGGEDLFAIARISVSELASARLEDFRVIVLGDLEALEPAAVAAVERYVAAGGGVLVGLGPRTRAELVNRFWARGGDGFLSCPLGELRQGRSGGELPASAALAHPAMSAFGGDAAEAWKAGRVYRHYALDLNAVRGGEVETLVALESGDALLVERRRGLGRVALFTTSLDLSWSDLAVQPAFVPLVRGIVSFLGGDVLPPRNLVPGERLTHSLASRSGSSQAAAVRAELRTEPPGALQEVWKELSLVPGTWEGRPCVVSEPLREAGVCRVVEPAELREGSGPAGPTWYAISLHPDETRLERLGRDELDRALGGLEPLALSTPEEIRAELDPKGRRPVEIWRELVLASLALLFVETLLTRRQAISEGRGAPAGRREGERQTAPPPGRRERRGASNVAPLGASGVLPVSGRDEARLPADQVEA